MILSGDRALTGDRSPTMVVTRRFLTSAREVGTPVCFSLEFDCSELFGWTREDLRLRAMDDSEHRLAHDPLLPNAESRQLV